MSNIMDALQAVADYHWSSSDNIAYGKRNYTWFKQLCDAVEGGQVGDVQTLSVTRTGLIAQFQAKLAEIDAAYDGAATKLDEADAGRDAFDAATAEYYRAIAEGVAAGHYTVDRHNNLGTVKDGPGLPEFPTAPREKSNVDRARRSLEAARAEAKAPFQEQVELLLIGATDAVDVVQASVAGLLRTEVPTVDVLAARF